MTRPMMALLFGLIAWAVFAYMVIAPFLVIAPFFANPDEYWFSPRLDYALELTPLAFVLSLTSFLLADRYDTASRRATWASVLLALSLLLYWLVPWAWNILNPSY